MLLPTLSLCAGSVSEAEARQKVQAFLQQRGKKTSSQRVKLMKKGRRTGTPASSVGYYLFNLGETDGFVIVSGDDRTTAILGYADSGSINEDDMPDGLRYLLEGYEEQMANIPDEVEAPLQTSSRAPIDPLIKTNWNQGNPYNYLCPLITGKHAVTGCVATSMAQVMYYYKDYQTKSCLDIPAYSKTTQNKAEQDTTLNVPALPATTFDWDNMIDDYNPINPETGKKYVGGTDAQQVAVATLMQYCGSSIEMIYGLSSNGGSSAYNEAIPFALKTYFGYDGGINHAYRKNYSYDAWIDLIYNELAANRPVILGGQSMGGGHSFVCDGYDTNDHAGADGDYFHMNWGWGGSSDGYFLLSVLQPWEQGIGGSSTLDGFSFAQDVVYGIQPPVDGNADYCMSLEGQHLGGDDKAKSSITYNRNGDGAFTGISIYYDVWNYYYGSNNSFDVALQLQDASGNVVQTFDTHETDAMAWNKHYSTTVNATIPQSVANGTYYIKVMSRLRDAGSWQECYDGDAYKMTATIADNQLTINVPIPGNVKPTTATLSVTGDYLYGHEQTVTAAITGGEGPYNGDVILRVDDKAVVGTIVNIAAGETKELQFSYIPNRAGNNTVELYNSRTGGSRIGTAKTINIKLSLSDNKNNNTAVENNDGVTTDVTLANRTLYKDGGWNTICLPFNVTIEGSPLDGAIARTLDANNTTLDGTTLNLNFANAVTKLIAGTPYIIRWEKANDYVDDDAHNIVSPTFTNVTIVKGMQPVETSYVDFVGTYDYQSFTEDNRSILFVGEKNQLYWPQNGAHLGAFRAYFQLNGITAADVSSGARMSFDETTDIDNVSCSTHDVQRSTLWYDLSGRQLSGRPTQKGLYIHHGRKVIQ